MFRRLLTRAAGQLSDGTPISASSCVNFCQRGLQACGQAGSQLHGPLQPWSADLLHLSRSFASEAAATQDKAKAKAGGKGGKQPTGTQSSSKDGSKGSSSTKQQQEAAQVTNDPATQFRPSRFLAYQREVLHREMMLKIGQPQDWAQVPTISSVVLTINAQTDTRLEAAVVDKKDLLLYFLALEHLVGPAAKVGFVAPPNTRNPLAASGVSTTLTGSAALDFLEKLIYAVLPNQTSFEGLPNAQLITHKSEKSGRQYAVDLKVDNLLLYPDFEANFELFEPLRSMQVRIVVDKAPSGKAATAYLSSFGLPPLPAAVAAAAAAAAAETKGWPGQRGGSGKGGKSRG